MEIPESEGYMPIGITRIYTGGPGIVPVDVNLIPYENRVIMRCTNTTGISSSMQFKVGISLAPCA